MPAILSRSTSGIRSSVAARYPSPPTWRATNRRCRERDRELLIMRTAFLCRNDATWDPHRGPQAARLRRRGGRPDRRRTTRRRVVDGSRRPCSQAADDLRKDQFIQDATWKTLTARSDDPQIMDAVFAVGQNTMISMYLNSVGAQLGPGDKKPPTP